jgi:pimeloyl-ACP methyl ester carboxylesterase
MSPHLEVRGPGPGAAPGRPPLLLVPGLGHEAGCWDNWRTAAGAAGHPAYAMSLRGHGTSTGRLRTARLGQYRDDVVRVARSLPEAPILVGHSMGGLVSAMAAARTPARGLVLVATVPARPGFGCLASVARQHPGDAVGLIAGRTLRMRPAYLFEGLDETTAASYVSRAGKESPIAQHQLVLHRPPAAPLGDPPVLVLAATADRLVPLRDVRATARRYDAELVELDGIGHNLMQDSGWERGWAAVEDWLSRTLSQSGQVSPAGPAGSRRSPSGAGRWPR